jgi:hypothetical protein
MEKIRGSAEAIQEIIKLGNKMSINEMVQINEQVTAMGGKLVSVTAADDDDWCGNGKFVIKWPLPKPNDFIKLLDRLVMTRVDFEILVNGTPVPEEIMMRVSRQLRG